MVRLSLGVLVTCMLFMGQLVADEEGSDWVAKQVEGAIYLTPDIDHGREIYSLCAVCHAPEGWGTKDGYYPQVAGQHFTVTIKQLADILARNRDTPTMFPFTQLELMRPQDFADVAAYLEHLPMTRDNGVGPGTDLGYGKRLYEKNCVDCHGENGEGIKEEFMPLIQGQHYNYLVRQFEWIKEGKRRNADEEMVEQIQTFRKRDISAIMDYTSRLKPPAERLAAPDWQNPDFPEFVR